MRPQIFLEIFSGCGRLAAELRKLGYLVLERDVLRGPSWDLTLRCNQRLIRGWIAAGHVWGAHLGTPCSTWSRARDRGPIRDPDRPRPGPPSRLRSDEHLLGLPELRHPADLEAFRIGNELARLSISIMEQLKHQQRPVTLENPSSSRIWLLPRLLKAKSWKSASCIDTCYCMFGEKWKKPTRFLGCRIDLTDIHRVCTGRTCCRTGLPHLTLSGFDGPRGWLTKKSEKYPVELCSHLARAFANARAALDIHKSSRV